tara:strand:+ start:54 stop:458 length:405 start_codon:yes stop_codon:yes gene_type:complete
MSSTSRPVDLVRDHIRNNVLTTYSPAIMWDESEQPFTNKDSSIILARQEGRSVNDFIRVHDVQVWVFSKAGADIGDASTLFNDANLACDYIMSVNLVLADADQGKAPLVIEHVTGPYKTSENRYFYRFTVRVLS